ncbi:MAG: carboxylesterase [Moraxellaceae bacterium]|nr:MAG: carboxylesterase [Moraxellaceae bacterium]
MTTTVETTLGTLQGIQRPHHIEFRGIPYAAAPINELRFQAPQPLEPWQGVRRADLFGDASIQNNISLFGVGNTSEDCLYLNVWTPNTEAKKRPVMVWIHGGGYISGSGSQLIYRSNTLCESGDVVVVAINYRLGVLGFLDLTQHFSSDLPVSCNNGLLDQIAALNWVKDNIAAFGGDPDQVTVFGESAGAMSIAALMTSPLAKGLFGKAILQSGSGDHVLTKEESARVADCFLQATGISAEDPDALFNLSEKQILDAQKKCMAMSLDESRNQNPKQPRITQFSTTLSPVIDGEILPTTPIRAIESGIAADIVLMVGSARDEWNLFLHTPGPDGESLAKTRYKDINKKELIEICEQDLPGLGEKSANLYEKVLTQRSDSASVLDMYSAFESDRMFRIPTLRIAEAQSKHRADVFFFEFTWDKGVFGACHAIDVPFIFGCTQAGVGQILTGGGDKAVELSETVQSSWIAFARSGNPGTDKVGQWPGYTPSERKVMCFNDTVELIDDPQQDTRSHWDGIL